MHIWSLTPLVHALFVRPPCAPRGINRRIVNPDPLEAAFDLVVVQRRIVTSEVKLGKLQTSAVKIVLPKAKISVLGQRFSSNLHPNKLPQSSVHGQYISGAQ